MKPNNKRNNKTNEKEKVVDMEENDGSYQKRKYKKIYKNRDDVVISGVCSGIGEYLNIDTKIIRVGFLVGLFMTGFSFVIVYLVLWILMPNRD
ncbi:MAG: PspC domain-containing protein [Nanoarchaeales archaeon]|nr:PspC domain-containing protein [Nanoarchaeales archaeon]